MLLLYVLHCTALLRTVHNDTLHKELSDAGRRRIKIALQKQATREVLEGGEALEGWLPD